MTSVAHSVIVTDNGDLKAEVLAKVFVGIHGVEQSFEQVLGRAYVDGRYEAGGSVFFVCDVFAAAFNHVEPEIVADWFESLSWRGWDNASLTIHGNDYSLFVLVVDGECRRVGSEGSSQ